MKMSMKIFTASELHKLDAEMRQRHRNLTFRQLLTRAEDLGFTHYQGRSEGLFHIPSFLDMIGRHEG